MSLCVLKGEDGEAGDPGAVGLPGRIVSVFTPCGWNRHAFVMKWDLIQAFRAPPLLDRVRLQPSLCFSSTREIKGITGRREIQAFQEQQVPQEPEASQERMEPRATLWVTQAKVALNKVTALCLLVLIRRSSTGTGYSASVQQSSSCSLTQCNWYIISELHLGYKVH